MWRERGAHPTRSALVLPRMAIDHAGGTRYGSKDVRGGLKERYLRRKIVLAPLGNRALQSTAVKLSPATWHRLSIAERGTVNHLYAGRRDTSVAEILYGEHTRVTASRHVKFSAGRRKLFYIRGERGGRHCGVERDYVRGSWGGGGRNQT